MTCIIGYNDKRNQKIYMIGDSAGVSNYDICERDDKKVFTNGDFLFGFTSSFRMGQILRFLDIPKQKDDLQSDYEYMCTTFIDAIIAAFKDKNFGKTVDGERHGGIFMAAYRGTLYTIHSDFQVGICSRGFDSVGCGESYALGAMAVKDLCKDEPLNEDDLVDVMDCVIKLSCGVIPPYTLKTVRY